MPKWNILDTEYDYNKSYYCFLDLNGDLIKKDITKNDLAPEEILQSLETRALDFQITGYKLVHDNIGYSFKFDHPGFADKYEPKRKGEKKFKLKCPKCGADYFE